MVAKVFNMLLRFSGWLPGCFYLFANYFLEVEKCFRYVPKSYVVSKVLNMLLRYSWWLPGM